MHKSVLIAKFEFFLESLSLIETWFRDIHQPDDFINTSLGRSHFDATLMRLQTIGEVLKKIENEHPDLLPKYPQVEWYEIIRLREIISHHYEQLSHEIIFRVCTDDVTVLKTTIENIIADLKSA